MTFNEFLTTFYSDQDTGGDPAPNDQDTGGTSDNDDNDDQQESGSDDQNNTTQGRTFTQDDLNRIVEKRLKRERKKWQQEMEEKRRKEQMTAEERAKAEKEEAERKAREQQEAANRRIVRAEAKVQAAALGVKPERLNYVLRLADLNDIEVDDDGEPDTTEIKSKIDAVLNELPELKGAKASVGGGSNPASGSNDSNSTTFTRDQVEKMSPEEIDKNWDAIQRLMAEGKL